VPGHVFAPDNLPPRKEPLCSLSGWVDGPQSGSGRLIRKKVFATPRNQTTVPQSSSLRVGFACLLYEDMESTNAVSRKDTTLKSLVWGLTHTDPGILKGTRVLYMADVHNGRGGICSQWHCCNTITNSKWLRLCH
jgi:hypothetical protein